METIYRCALQFNRNISSYNVYFMVTRRKETL